MPYGPHIGWRGVTSVQGGVLADYNQIDTHVLKWNPAKSGYPKSLHIRATRDWDIPSKLRFDAIYPSVAILVSRQFRAANWLITTKTLVVDGTLLTQSFSFLKDWEIMYHSLYMWKSCSEPMPYGPHIGWRGVTSVQGGILADYDQIDTHVLKWNPAKFGYPKSLHIRATRDWDIPSKLRFDAIYPSVAILVSRQFRAAYWLITTKTLVVDGTLLTQSFSFLKDWEIMYHSLYMWKSCSEPMPYGPHIGWRGVTSVQGGILAYYDQIGPHVLKWNPAKFGYPKSLHIRATRDWDIPSKLRFDAIYPSLAILVSRQFRAAYWLITTKTLVVDGTLLTQSFSFLKDWEIMYHSLYMWKSCSEPMPYGPHIGWRGVTSVQGGILADYNQIDTHVLKWNPAKFGYPKSLHIRATRDWDIPSKLRFDVIYPSVAILVSRQFRAAYWLITTKTLVVDGTLLTQSFSFLKDWEIMYHSLYMWKSCSEPMLCGSHIGWRGVTSVQGGILADYDQIDTHVLKWNPAKFGYPKSLHIRATRDWDIPSKLRFDAIYPSVAILVSRQLRAAYWLITTKTLVVDGTLLTQSFSFLKDWEIMYHSLYMWKSCSEPMPYGPHIGWRGVTTVQGGILPDYYQIGPHVLKWNPAKFGYPKSLHIRATSDWDIPSKLRFDVIYPSVAILVSRQLRAAYWLITTKTLVVDGTLLTQSFSFLKDWEIMYHSLYMWKSCSEPMLYGSHIGWRGVMSVQGGILADYDQIDTHVLKWNPAKFGYPKSLHIRATRDWDIPSKLRFDAIYPSVAILVSRQFRAAYWLITTKTLVVDGTLLTQSFSFLKDWEIMYHSLYMWKSCSEPMPYGPHIGWRGVTSVQGGILADYNQIGPHVLKWNPAKFGYPKSLHIRATSDWDIPSKLRFDVIYPSVAILVSRQFRAAYWLITTKTLVVDGTLLTQSFSFLKDWEIMYHSLYMWKSCSEPMLYGSHIGWRGVMSVQGGILADYDQIDTHVLKWNPAKFGYPKSLHIRATRDWDIPSKLRFDAIYPSVAILVSRQFRAAYWLITTKTLVVDGTLLTQSFSFLKDWEIMYHSLYMWKSCSEPMPYGPHIGWRGVTSVQGGILADYDQIDTHVLKWNPAKFGYPKSLHIRATRDWDIPPKLRFDAIYPSVAILVSRQFRAAYWLITTKTLVVDGTLLTQSFSFLKEWEIMYHSLYMWKSCSEPMPYGPHIGWRGVTSVQGGILADYDQIGPHVLKWNPAKFGYPKSLHIRATSDWDIPSKLRFDVIYPSVAILVSRQFRAAYWLITTKTLVVDGTLLTQSFSFLKDWEIMYHSLYMWKSCSEPMLYGSHIGWRGVMSVQGGILADYDQIDTHVLKWNPAEFGYPKSLHIRATRDWDIPSKLRFDVIYPSVAILVSRQFRAAYWLITTKTLVVDGTLLTQSFSFLKDWEIMYHSLYMWKSCSEPMPYGPHIGCRGVTSVQGGILADYDQIDTHVLKWNPAKFGYPKSLHIRATRDWDIPPKLRFDAIYPSVAILVSRQFRAAYWLITTKTLVVDGTLLTQSFSFLKDWEIMYHSLYMWKSCSEPMPYGPHIGGRDVTSVQGGILADYNQIDTHVLKWNPAKFGYPKSLHIGTTRDWDIPSKLRFDLYNCRWPSWCHVNSGRHIGWLRPKLKSWMGLSWHKVSASSKNGKLCTTHIICGNLVPSQCLTDPILTDVVSRQFRAAYWLITTKLIHMSWSEILPSLVILSLFTFELHVIEIFLPNYVLMLYIRRWPSWCHVSSGRHIGWLRPKL